MDASVISWLRIIWNAVQLVAFVVAVVQMWRSENHGWKWIAALFLGSGAPIEFNGFRLSAFPIVWILFDSRIRPGDDQYEPIV